MVTFFRIRSIAELTWAASFSPRIRSMAVSNSFFLLLLPNSIDGGIDPFVLLALADAVNGLGDLVSGSSLDLVAMEIGFSFFLALDAGGGDEEGNVSILESAFPAGGRSVGRSPDDGIDWRIISPGGGQVGKDEHRGDGRQVEDQREKDHSAYARILRKVSQDLDAGRSFSSP